MKLVIMWGQPPSAVRRARARWSSAQTSNPSAVFAIEQVPHGVAASAKYSSTNPLRESYPLSFRPSPSESEGAGRNPLLLRWIPSAVFAVEQVPHGVAASGVRSLVTLQRIGRLAALLRGIVFTARRAPVRKTRLPRFQFKFLRAHDTDLNRKCHTVTVLGRTLKRPRAKRVDEI